MRNIVKKQRSLGQWMTVLLLRKVNVCECVAICSILEETLGMEVPGNSCAINGAGMFEATINGIVRQS